MKKLTSIMLALALTIGTAGITLAQADKDAKTTTKKGKGKKAKDATKDGDAKDGKAKKGKKAKDAPTK